MDKGEGVAQVEVQYEEVVVLGRQVKGKGAKARVSSRAVGPKGAKRVGIVCATRLRWSLCPKNQRQGADECAKEVCAPSRIRMRRAKGDVLLAVHLNAPRDGIDVSRVRTD